MSGNARRGKTSASVDLRPKQDPGTLPPGAGQIKNRGPSSPAPPRPFSPGPLGRGDEDEGKSMSARRPSPPPALPRAPSGGAAWGPRKKPGEGANHPFELWLTLPLPPGGGRGEGETPQPGATCRVSTA